MNSFNENTQLTTSKLKTVIVGHVDHGKSTLIGRLFHDTDSLPEGKIEQIRNASTAEGMEFEFAFLLDALLEEQEQNITIDTTQLPFRTKLREYVIIDAPGHKEFLKNMITGAANADAAILLIDAHEGIQEQSKRHAYLLSLLGVEQVIVAINKMDLVGFKQEIFDRVCAEYSEFLKSLNIIPRQFIPISAKHGHNITAPSSEMQWFTGPAILDALDQLDTPKTLEGLPLRFVLQDIYRFDERRILAGHIESGRLTVGEELVFCPNSKSSRIKTIESWGSDIPKTSAFAGESVAITLEEQIFVERGQIASSINGCPIEGREIQASLFWLCDEPLALDKPFNLKIGTQSVEGRVKEFQRILNSSTLEPITESRTSLLKNEVADVLIRLRKPIAFDSNSYINSTGRFVIIVGKRIGGGGIVREANYKHSEVINKDITWTLSNVSRESRAKLFGHRGAVIWLTGLSGSGKSTLATALENQLCGRGIASFVLDGDNLRHGLCSNLSFTHEDRTENIRRAGETAKIMAEAGLVVICSLISPYRADRDIVRRICQHNSIPFAEVFINASLQTCESRDPRGLYKKARSGEISNFTGVSSPYEPPESPELEIVTDVCTKEDSLIKLVDFAGEFVSHSF